MADTKRGKKKTTPGQLLAMKRRQPKDSFNIDAPGPTIDGQPQQQPSLLTAVRELHRTRNRRDYVEQLAKRYGCGIRTVDRAISVAEQEWLEEAQGDRPKRVAKTYATYKRLAAKAEAAGDDTKAGHAKAVAYRAAAAIMKQGDKLLGDDAPKKLHIDGPAMGLSADQKMDRAEKLRALALAALQEEKDEK